MLIYSYAINLAIAQLYNLKNLIKQLRKDKNLENQEILILKLKIKKRYPKQKNKKRREVKQKQQNLYNTAINVDVIIVKLIIRKNKNLLKGIAKSKTIQYN